MGQAGVGKPSHVHAKFATYKYRNKHFHGPQPIRKFSLAVMDEKRRKDLCYHCDEKWNPQHRCKDPKIYVLHSCEKPIDITFDLEELVLGEVSQDAKSKPILDEPQISINATLGMPTNNTMRISEHIRGKMW